MSRSATIDRQTAETQIHLTLSLDGSGSGQIATPVPFMNHMLNLMVRHGFFDLVVQAAGDVEVDDHHTVEDLGICLGQAFARALGDKQGIRRYGDAVVPMDETLATVAVDFSGRARLVFNVPLPKARVGTFEVELVEEFFAAFCNHAAANVHVNLAYGSNLHHIVEAVFKAFGRALDAATGLDPRVRGVLSTKGKL
ncbi:imidazoleglycerol-phosphate dehydratase HisB [Desulfuromonas sp. CSMB_57]|jgi:imidazoleglycerol-phosphate dehydratase|uniref:imidazoleglycerol-phosphate dehydratase HisB n=1 Tax=Desulfuromonas sp. CSMB_57 TaxID=2807629 RepID=UPI001CD81150|nr:imidazoleglycerol-phosphate dehydratase HisB [Desulfuromonas sp. CSMB_57]